VWRARKTLVEATQNADVFAEVSGILKACAVNLLKISSDLRLLSSGPEAGLGEIKLPARQAGSSIMPGKVNPVIPEAVSQAALLVMSHDAGDRAGLRGGEHGVESVSASRRPLSARPAWTCLANAARILCRFCVEGMTADEERLPRPCRRVDRGGHGVGGALGL